MKLFSYRIFPSPRHAGELQHVQWEVLRLKEQRAQLSSSLEACQQREEEQRVTSEQTDQKIKEAEQLEKQYNALLQVKSSVFFNVFFLLRIWPCLS